MSAAGAGHGGPPWSDDTFPRSRSNSSSQRHSLILAPDEGPRRGTDFAFRAIGPFNNRECPAQAYHELNDDVVETVESGVCGATFAGVVARSTFVFLSMSALLVLAYLHFANTGRVFWSQSASGGRCEEPKVKGAHTPGFGREPVNTYSNYGFWVSGSYIVCGALFDGLTQSWGCCSQSRKFSFSPLMAGVLGLQVMYQGVASTIYHACSCGGIGGMLDVAAIVGILLSQGLCIIHVAIPRFLCFPSQYILVPLQILGAFISHYWQWGMAKSGMSWTGAYIIFVVGISLFGCCLFTTLLKLKWTRTPSHPIFLVIAVPVIVVGLVVWAPEEVFHNCKVDTLKIFHGIFHVCCAIALAFAMTFFRTLGYCPNQNQGRDLRWCSVSRGTSFLDLCKVVTWHVTISTKSSSTSSEGPSTIGQEENILLPSV